VSLIQHNHEFNFYLNSFINGAWLVHVSVHPEINSVVMTAGKVWIPSLAVFVDFSFATEVLLYSKETVRPITSPKGPEGE
jgi:hypothetical protein